MRKYRFELVETNVHTFKEKDHVILASSLTDAVQKFVRKHDLEAPAYWDEPFFDKEINLTFTHDQGRITYSIFW